jgi:hypothetical protein
MRSSARVPGGLGACKGARCSKSSISPCGELLRQRWRRTSRGLQIGALPPRKTRAEACQNKTTLSGLGSRRGPWIFPRAELAWPVCACFSSPAGLTQSPSPGATGNRRSRLTLFREKRSTAKITQRKRWVPGLPRFLASAFETEKPTGPLWGVSVAHRAPPFGLSHLVFLAPWRFKNFGLRITVPPTLLQCQARRDSPSRNPFGLMGGAVPLGKAPWMNRRTRAAGGDCRFLLRALQYTSP